MKRYYANLLGKWTDITENGTVEDGKSPSIYFEEMLTFQNGSTVAECFKYGYINVQYGKLSIKEAKEILKSAPQIIDFGSEDEKKRLVSKLIKKIIVNQGDIDIHWSFT